MTTELVAISGNTYPVKEQLKALGARWNGDLKAWMVTADKVDEARKIVAGAGPKQFRPRQQYATSRSNRYYGNQSRYDNECELCGKNKYTCGHCIGW